MPSKLNAFPNFPDVDVGHVVPEQVPLFPQLLQSLKNDGFSLFSPLNLHHPIKERFQSMNAVAALVTVVFM